MSVKKEKKIYWSSGVTRDEVVRSLNDENPSVFRNQRHRRQLTIFAAAWVMGMSCTVFLSHPKLKSYLDFLLLAVSLVLYFQLRKSVRSVADAPDELLDERQIAIRNSAYLVAYRWLAGVFMIHTIGYLLAVEVMQLDVAWSNFTQVLIALCMWVACLPSMALAWSLPSETQFLDDSK
jgi:hypothetical protein